MCCLLIFVACLFLQLTYQLAEVQRQQKTAEATVRQLRTDLALAQKELGEFCFSTEKISALCVVFRHLSQLCGFSGGLILKYNFTKHELIF